MRIGKYPLGLAVFMAIATPAIAAEDIMPMPKAGAGAFSASTAITTEYYFRGLSQTNDKPAVQGSLGYSYDFGGVTGSGSVWASNVNFGDATIEIDYTLGLGGDVKGISWGVGGIYYAYPGSDDRDAQFDQDYIEMFGTLGYDFKYFALGAGINYSPDFQAESGKGMYYNANVRIPLGKYLDLGASIGRQTISNNTNFGQVDWVDYKVGVSTVLAGFDRSWPISTPIIRDPLFRMRLSRFHDLPVVLTARPMPPGDLIPPGGDRLSIGGRRRFVLLPNIRTQFHL